MIYFEVYLKDGDDDYIVCICKEKDEELVYRTLAIIPRENVKYILAKGL